MPQSRGKDFEQIIRKGFMDVPNTSVYRLYDTMGGMSGIANISDFIIYRYPNQYFIECKAVHGNTLSISSNDPKRKYGNVSNTQWDGMLEMSKIRGVFAGVICWFVDNDVTIFLGINALEEWRNAGHKSVNVKDIDEMIQKYHYVFYIDGEKKRIFFDYDMKKFFEKVPDLILVRRDV